MNWFIKIVGGRQLYVEYATWARPDRRFLLAVDGREIILWVGRLNMIYTPAAWAPRLRSMTDDRSGRAYGR